MILDASALLALLNNEPGAERVMMALSGGACISAVNLSEVIAKLNGDGVPAAAIRTLLSGIDCEVVAFTEDHAYAAGLLRESTRHVGTSFGDRACIALGQFLNMPVLTGDRRWAALDLQVRIELFR